MKQSFCLFRLSGNSNLHPFISAWLAKSAHFSGDRYKNVARFSGAAYA